MTRQRIVHLVDDTTAGGVMRAAAYLTTHPALSTRADHLTCPVRKGALRAQAYEADVIVSHTTLCWRGLPGLISLRAKNPQARLIHVEHSYTQAFTALNVRRRKRFFALLRLSYALFDHVVAVSRTQGAWLRGRALVPADRLSVIPPLVDVAPFEAVAQVPAPAKTIGAIGRLERQKGFDILIAGFQNWPDPDARLLIFGEGREEAHLHALAQGDPRITFCGHTQDPAAAMARVDVVAIPSRWEAYGLVCLEALAAGRRVIAARVDGLKDDGRGAVQTVPANTPEAWTRALSQACLAPAQLPPAPSPVDAQDAPAWAGWARSWAPLLG